MDQQAAEQFEDRFGSIVQKIRDEPSLIDRLPAFESRIVREALSGRAAREIVNEHHVSQGYVFTLIDNVARATGGQAY